MSGRGPLGAADLHLIHLVAARRRGEEATRLDPAAVEAVLGRLRDAGEPPAPTPFDRAARLAGEVSSLLSGGIGRQVALLALVCQLRLDGYQLTAPQGVLAAMVQAAAGGSRDDRALARWLEDRALAYGPRSGAGW